MNEKDFEILMKLNAPSGVNNEREMNKYVAEGRLHAPEPLEELSVSNMASLLSVIVFVREYLQGRPYYNYTGRYIYQQALWIDASFENLRNIEISEKDSPEMFRLAVGINEAVRGLRSGIGKMSIARLYDYCRGLFFSMYREHGFQLVQADDEELRKRAIALVERAEPYVQARKTISIEEYREISALYREYGNMSTRYLSKETISAIKRMNVIGRTGVNVSLEKAREEKIRASLNVLNCELISIHMNLGRQEDNEEYILEFKHGGYPDRTFTVNADKNLERFYFPFCVDHGNHTLTDALAVWEVKMGVLPTRRR